MSKNIIFSKKIKAFFIINNYIEENIKKFRSDILQIYHDEEFLDLILDQIDYPLDIHIDDFQFFIKTHLCYKDNIIKSLESIDLSVICPNPEENIFWIQREVEINHIIDMQRAYLVLSDC